MLLGNKLTKLYTRKKQMQHIIPKLINDEGTFIITACNQHQTNYLVLFFILLTAVICNKTKIKEFYKTCRTVVAYLALLDIIQIAKNW